MDKALKQTVPAILKIAGFFSKFRDAFTIQIPVGYQDENGFHFGNEPAKKEINWPPAL